MANFFIPFADQPPTSPDAGPSTPDAGAPSVAGLVPGINPSPGRPATAASTPRGGLFSGGLLAWPLLAIDVVVLAGLVLLVPRVLSKLVDD